MSRKLALSLPQTKKYVEEFFNDHEELVHKDEPGFGPYGMLVSDSLFISPSLPSSSL